MSDANPAEAAGNDAPLSFDDGVSALTDVLKDPETDLAEEDQGQEGETEEAEAEGEEPKEEEPRKRLKRKKPKKARTDPVTSQASLRPIPRMCA
jgi:hypothetical protein